MIDKTAIISKKSRIGKNVSIGPYCIIEDDVVIGDNTSIGPYTLIKKFTEIGRDCRIFSHCVIGEIPQDKKFNNEITKLIIGDNNTIREFCTINRGTEESGKTIIGK